MPPDRLTIDRFARDLARLVDPPCPMRPLALAVSGGPDSMAMLALAAAAFPDRVIAATVDHALRPDAAAEAAMVAGWASANGVPHATLTARCAPTGASLQAQARQLRYALLGDWAIAQGAAALATAHHADDQAETFLMRAARGSGPAGLAGIRPRWSYRADRWRGDDGQEPRPIPPSMEATPADHRHPEPAPGSTAPRPMAADGQLASPLVPRQSEPVRAIDPPSAVPIANSADVGTLPIVRPLLAWRRAELLAVAAALPFVNDPSNADPRHDRTAVRALLADGHFDPVALAAAAAHCREADAALSETVDWLWRTRRLPAAAMECRLDMTGLPRELRRRLVRAAIGHVRLLTGVAEGRWSAGVNIEPLLASLIAGGQGTQAGILATATGEAWHFRQHPPRRKS